MNLADGRQNLVFLDDVRVPANRMLGDLNQGWQQVWFGIGGNPIPTFESDDPGPEEEYEPRPGRPRMGARPAGAVLPVARPGNGAPLTDDPVVRMQLADLAIGVEARSCSGTKAGARTARTCTRRSARSSSPSSGRRAWRSSARSARSRRASGRRWPGEIDRIYRRSFGNHAGGTSQVKRMVVATRGLGLPR